MKWIKKRGFFSADFRVKYGILVSFKALIRTNVHLTRIDAPN